MAARLEIDQYGRLERGAFYAIRLTLLHNMSDIADEWYMQDRATVVQRTDELEPKDVRGNETWFYVENCSDYNSSEVIERCATDSSHTRAEIYTDPMVDLFGGPIVPPIIADDFCIVSADLQRGIGASGIRGSDFRSIRIKVNQSGYPEPKLYAWQFRGTPIARVPSVIDGENVCPFCGEAPVVCRGCGRNVNNPCTRCKRWTLQNVEVKERFDERKIGFNYGELQKTVVLEGKHWDGSDLIYGSFVTKRVVDFLLKVHAAPFVAWPVRVCVDGMNDDQRAWLEEAVKPL